MIGVIGAAFIAFVLTLVWCACKAAAIADRDMEALMAKRKDDTNESGKEVSTTDTKV